MDMRNYSFVVFVMDLDKFSRKKNWDIYKSKPRCLFESPFCGNMSRHSISWILAMAKALLTFRLVVLYSQSDFCQFVESKTELIRKVFPNIWTWRLPGQLGLPLFLFSMRTHMFHPIELKVCTVNIGTCVQLSDIKKVYRVFRKFWYL